MKILYVISGNIGIVPPFVKDQVESLSPYDIETGYFSIYGKGHIGYLQNLSKLKSVVSEFRPDFIHAHYGLSGFFSNFQRTIPVITTYHGSDINFYKNRLFSYICAALSICNIFVSGSLKKKIFNSNGYVIPCGVDMANFNPFSKQEARKKLNLSLSKKYILFSSSFSRPEKNYSFAKEIIAALNTNNVNLIEFKGYSRHEANLLYNAADLGLMTSIYEGSPQFIKEALACNCPIVTNKVGDVHTLLEGVENCFIVETKDHYIEKIRYLLNHDVRSNGREKIGHLDLKLIARQLYDVYRHVLATKHRQTKL